MQSYKEVIDSTEYRIIVKPAGFYKTIKKFRIVETERPKAWDYRVYSKDKLVGSNIFAIYKYDDAVAQAKQHTKELVEAITRRYSFAETQDVLSQETLTLTAREVLAL